MGLNNNWNESIQTIENEQVINEYKECENEHTFSIIQKFKKDYQRFFSGYKVSPHATQSYQHVMKLIKQRLDRHGVKLDINFKGKKTDKYNITWTDDGKGLAANVKEEIDTERIYKKGNKVVGDFKNKEVVEYVVVETDCTKADIQCLNCGGPLHKFDNNYTCSFCQSVFLQQEFNKHVATLRTRKDYEVAKNRILNLRKWMIKRIPIIAYIFTYLSGYLFSYFIGEKSNLHHSTARLFCLTLGSSIAFVSITIGFIITSARSIIRKVTNANNIYNEYARNIPFENRVKEFDPRFSLENFESMLQNRLIMLHIAHRQQEVSSFIKADCDSFISKYKNIVDCILESVNYHNYFVDDELQHIDLTASMLLYEYEDDTICMNKEKIGISLIKSRAATNQSFEDALLFTCASCGHNLDLMKGGCCEACGNELNLTDYDWVIVKCIPGENLGGMVEANVNVKEQNQGKNTGVISILSHMFDLKGVNVPAIICAIIVFICLFLPTYKSDSLMHIGEAWLHLIFVVIYLAFITIHKNILAFIISLLIIFSTIFYHDNSIGYYVMLISSFGTVFFPVYDIIKEKLKKKNK